MEQNAELINARDFAKLSYNDYAQLANSDFKAFVNKLMEVSGESGFKHHLKSTLQLNDEQIRRVEDMQQRGVSPIDPEERRLVELMARFAASHAAKEHAHKPHENDADEEREVRALGPIGAAMAFAHGDAKKNGALLGSMLKPGHDAFWEALEAQGEISHQFAAAAKDVSAHHEENVAQTQQRLDQNLEHSNLKPEQKEKAKEFLKSKEGKSFAEREAELDEVRRLEEEAARNGESQKIKDALRKRKEELEKQQQQTIQQQKNTNPSTAAFLQQEHDNPVRPTSDSNHYSDSAQSLRQKSKLIGTPDVKAGAEVAQMISDAKGDSKALNKALEDRMKQPDGEAIKAALTKALANRESIKDPAAREALSAVAVAAKGKGLISDEAISKKADDEHIQKKNSISAFEALAPNPTSKAPLIEPSKLAAMRESHDVSSPQNSKKIEF